MQSTSSHKDVIVEVPNISDPSKGVKIRISSVIFSAIQNNTPDNTIARSVSSLPNSPGQTPDRERSLNVGKDGPGY